MVKERCLDTPLMARASLGTRYVKVREKWGLVEFKRVGGAEKWEGNAII